MSKTSVALDNLRGFAILNVVAFHAFIAYLANSPAAPALPFDKPPYAWTANPIIDSARWLGFDLFCAFQYVYLMHLMFFLSGLFVWPSLQRKGARTFLFDRILRLGVPFLLGVYLLMPLAYYPVYLVTAVDPSWSAFWSQLDRAAVLAERTDVVPVVLLALNIIAAALFWLVPRAGEYLGRLSSGAGAHPGRYCLMLAGVTALVYVPLSLVFKPWQWVAFRAVQFSAELHPAIRHLFLRRPWARSLWLRARSARTGRNAGAALGLLGRRRADGIPAVDHSDGADREGTGGGLPACRSSPTSASMLASATACLALAAVFLRFATAHQPILHSLSENAYGIYFVHYVFVIWLQYLLLGVCAPRRRKGRRSYSWPRSC